jgi:hypothetical protein
VPAVSIGLKWDQKTLDQYAMFGGDFERRLAYGSVRALNDTAKVIQLAEFARARSIFNIRKEPFWFGTGGRVGGAAARITTFASIPKGKQFVEISAGTLPKGGDKLPGARHLLWRIFETGGTREPMVGKHVAVPVLGVARPNQKAEIVKAFTFQALAMRAYYKPPGKGKMRKLKRQAKYQAQLTSRILGEYGTAATGFKQISKRAKGIRWRGKNRTWVGFSKKHPLGAVYQRTGPGKLDFRIVWAFHLPFPLDDRLQFILTAQRVALKVFPAACAAELQRELAIDMKAAVRGLG